MLNVIYVSYSEFSEIKKRILKIQPTSSLRIHIFEAIDFGSAKNCFEELKITHGYEIKLYKISREVCIEQHWLNIISQYEFKNVLLLCADEELLLNSDDQVDLLNADYVEFPRRNLVGGYVLKGGGWAEHQDYQLRYIRNPVPLISSPKVHLFPFRRGEKIYRSRLPMIHYSYKDLSQFIERFNRYTSLESSQHKNKQSSLYIIYRSIRHFVRRYIFQQGYKDGALGFVLCALMGIYYSASVVKSENV
jgi:hypothetical protein